MEQIRARGFLTCGLPENVPGFAVFDAKGNAKGFDGDLCRAVAAAIFGQGDKVKFAKVDTAREFLQRPEIDLVFHGLTWKFSRELTSGLRFGPVSFYDGQAFLTSKRHTRGSLQQLRNAAICAQADTHFAAVARDYLQRERINVKMVLFETQAAANEAFFSGRCAALTADASSLFAAAIARPSGNYHLLPERISKEPLAPVVRRDDDELLTILRWTVYATIRAEELVVTAQNVADLRRADIPLLAGFLRTPVSAALGLAPDWTANVIASIGNYGEIFTRHFARAGTPIKMERGLNALWRDGGVHYAPPMR